MTLPDAINAAFEAAGAISQIFNVRQLLKDREVKGVHWGVTMFFGAWGLWNVVFYSSLHQWLSLAAGCGLVITNSIWLILLWRFHAHENLDPR